MLLAERDTAPELAAVQGAEQHRAPEVVVVHIVGDVVEIDTEADHRGLMGDGVDAGDGCLDRGRVGDVAPDILRRRITPLGPRPVRSRKQHVEHPDLVTVVHEGVDDVRSDEAGAAGHEHAHQARTRGKRTVKIAPPESFCTSRRP